MRAGVTIYFIRHGETDWNAQSRYQGQADVPLNDKGRGQARRNGETLRALAPETGALPFIASPLQRARETMEIVRSAMELPAEGYSLDPRLKEINYGAWQGTLAAELPQVDPDGLAARNLDTFNWRPEGGESYADLTQRAVGWLDGIDGDCVVVAHGGISRVLRGHLYALEPLAIPDLPVPQDRILILRRDGMEWI
ncbi:histidine phosphatase family protein [Hyphomicrobium sulfonivorans]|uniref:histidine phosphatase family protein n=1 Tax=Hyphomicrobium sulfonivorans TaxID=121290 RepID=UPI00156D705D|nr:histidine phosphatase family protein [Hyphomicrobium sulfonivorans]MBI1649249.1 histidine phosphatase family protein [Hyphomicrobium sulfonivorans]NSL70220.1 histidine phosphatase family protein [Hyphomicrobium sulfonivorans]